MKHFLFPVKDTGSTYVNIAWEFSDTEYKIGHYKVSQVLNIQWEDISINWITKKVELKQNTVKPD